MGVITDYFTAASDEVAAGFIDNGPTHGGLTDDAEVRAAYQTALRTGDRAAILAVFRPRVQETADGMPVLQSKGISPGVELDTVESLLTGASYDAISAGPRSAALVALINDGETLVLTCTDELQQALAAADEVRLAEAAAQWATSDEFVGRGNPGALTEFLTALAELARRAVARDERMYCWVCV